MEQWIQTDEAEDVAASVRHALRCYAFTREDQQAWKWVALALHSALQGACVCHLVMSATPLGIVDEKNAGEWIAYIERSRSDPSARPPQTRLLALPELVKAIRKPHSAGDRSNAQGVAISDQELGWLKRFHTDIRNDFTHFSPKGWSIEVSGIPALGKLISRIIGDILGMGYAFRHKDNPWRMRFSKDLTRLAAGW